jgi:4,4'-diaponeurosporenoate glycosyltransferase
MGPELIITPITAALWLASFGLLRRLALTPNSPNQPNQLNHRLSIIIPARNEAHNLPRLLESIRSQPTPSLEVLVVDDASTDATAGVAASHGATVISSLALPDGWRGKTWALHQGALAAKGELFLFLDADCWFEPGGLDRILSRYEGGALSVAPHHAVEKPYEELSAFFNVIMVASTTGHGLFGQMLLVDRASYDKAGGHHEVKGRVLENLRLAAFYRAAGVAVTSFPGRGMLAFRMYPEGFSSLIEGWTKGFASGASETPRAAVVLVALWITGLMLALIALPWTPWPFLAFALQFGVMLKRIGSFSWLTALFYPVPLFFYLAVFVRSLRRSGKEVTWKGREFRAD